MKCTESHSWGACVEEAAESPTEYLECLTTEKSGDRSLRRSIRNGWMVLSGSRRVRMIVTCLLFEGLAGLRLGVLGLGFGRLGVRAFYRLGASAEATSGTQQ